MDRYSLFAGFQFVDSYDNAHERRVQGAVGLEIGRHIDAHSESVMTCMRGEIQIVL